jgi:hypothetical protein
VFKRWLTISNQAFSSLPRTVGCAVNKETAREFHRSFWEFHAASFFTLRWQNDRRNVLTSSIPGCGLSVQKNKESEILRVRRGAIRMVRPVKPAPKGFVFSRPTMCLHCHLVVEMFHEPGADPRTGAWECPQCGHKYPFTHWKIKKAKKGGDQKEAA